MTIRKLHRCKRTAILNKWIETKWIGSPAKEWYKISLELFDNQSALTKRNSSTVSESVGIDKTSQQALTKRDGLPVRNVLAYKETMNKGDQEKRIKEETPITPLKNISIDFIDQIILVFTDTCRDYEIVDREKERRAAAKILKVWKKKYPDSTAEETLIGLTDFFQRCINIEEPWLHDHMSLPIIVSQFNVITKILKNGNSKRKQPGATAEQIADACAKVFATDYREGGYKPEED